MVPHSLQAVVRCTLTANNFVESATRSLAGLLPLKAALTSLPEANKWLILSIVGT